MSKDDDLSEFEGRIFVAIERKRIRKMLGEWERYKWGFRLFWRILAWVAGSIAAMFLGREEIYNAMMAIKLVLRL